MELQHFGILPRDSEQCCVSEGFPDGDSGIEYCFEVYYGEFCMLIVYYFCGGGGALSELRDVYAEYCLLVYEETELNTPQARTRQTPPRRTQ